MRQVFFLLALFFALWLGGLATFVLALPSRPAFDTETTDAIVVLTGGSMRLERGFALLADGRAAKMFISGVEDNVTVQTLLHRAEFRAYAPRIRASDITLGYRARSTIGNAAEIADWVQLEDVRSVRVVTGYYHMIRACHELHQAAPSLKLVPEPVFPRQLDAAGGWTFENARLVLSEYSKYLVSLGLAWRRE